MTCNVGTTIRNLLHDQFGVGENSIEERISTIFLDGKPVDDIDSVTVKNGATLALSGAMPGLVGATLRRKSPLASFRRTISSSDLIRKEEGTSTGIIRIKIFNVLINDIGPLFLERGIFLSACTLKSFLENLPDGFWRACEAVTVNDQVRAGGGSKEHVLSAVGDGWVHLSVKKKS